MEKCLFLPFTIVSFTKHSGHFIEPAWFALDVSHGLHTQELKFYMRMTVIISDFIIYFPAVIRFVRYWKRLKGGNSLNSVILFGSLPPPLIISVLFCHSHSSSACSYSY